MTHSNTGLEIFHALLYTTDMNISLLLYDEYKPTSIVVLLLTIFFAFYLELQDMNYLEVLP